MLLYPCDNPMMPITKCSHQCSSGFRAVLFVTALLRPYLGDLPIVAKAGVLEGSFKICIKARNPDQVPQIMRITSVGPPLVWKFVPLTSFRNASFERALHGVASQVISAVIQS
jgi:hypothetical protein